MSSESSNETIVQAKPDTLASSRRDFIKQAAITVAGVATGANALAQTPVTTAKTPPVKTPPPSPSRAPVPGYVDAKFDDFTKDYTQLPGLITLYRYRNDLLMEITADQLGKLFMLDATMSTGDAGFAGTVGTPIGDVPFRIEKENDQIYFVEPNEYFRATVDTPEATSLRRSFSESFLGEFQIVAIKLSKADQTKADAITDKADKATFIEGAAVSYLCPLKSFFLSDITDYLSSVSGYHADPNASFIQNVGVYPQNIVIQSLYALSGAPSPLFAELGVTATIVDDRSDPISISYNLFSLPDGVDTNAQGYVPRYYDDRIGFFTTDYETFDEDISDDNIKRLILRWHLVKKDPKAAVSDPVKPITFWIDNGMPIRYRPAAQEAVLAWNKAFEAIGFSNAVVCNIMPDNADWDTADLRYNVVRWMSSPNAGYAVALFRANPFTGEIFSASVNIDASMARFTNVEYPIILSELTGDQATAADANNVLPVGDGISTELMTPKTIARSRFLPKKPTNPFMRCTCDLPTQSQAHAAFGWDAVDLEGLDGTDTNITLEDYTHSYLRMVICHEVGHCLGLRHNFKASTMLSPAQLQDADSLNTYEVSASVMDYLPPNVAPLGGKPVPKYFSAGPGPYDIWAISYGYTDFGNIIPESDTLGLQKIASQDRAFGLDFGSDENADDVDPSITRFDLSSDPMEFGLLMLARGTHMLSTVTQKYPIQGDDYYELTRRYRRILFHTADDALALSRFVGGVLTYRNHKGDPGEVAPVRPVPFAQQRKALAGICKYLLSETAFSQAPQMLSMLEQDPRPLSDNSLFSGTMVTDYSWLDLFTNVQQMGLSSALDPTMFDRLQTNEFRATSTIDPDPPLTVLEAFQTVTNTVWSELQVAEISSKDKPSTLKIPVLRRRTQRTYVIFLSELTTVDFTGMSDDTKPVAIHELRRVSHLINAALLRPTDPTTEVHLSELQSGINRMLSATDVIPIGEGAATY